MNVCMYVRTLVHVLKRAYVFCRDRLTHRCLRCALHRHAWMNGCLNEWMKRFNGKFCVLFKFLQASVSLIASVLLWSCLSYAAFFQPCPNVLTNF